MTTITDFSYLLTLIGLHKPRVIVFEGMHCVGKSTMIKRLVAHTDYPVYNSWESYGGRKSIMDDSGAVREIYKDSGIMLAPAFIYAYDAVTQVSKTPVIFDRSYLSTLYYAKDLYNQDMFHSYVNKMDIMWILVDPVRCQAHKDFYNDNLLNSPRLNNVSYTDYCIELQKWVNMFDLEVPSDNKFILKNYYA